MESTRDSEVDKRKIIIAAAAALSTIGAVAQLLLEDDDDLPPNKVRKIDLPLMKNNPLLSQKETPRAPLKQRIDITELLMDPDRNYHWASYSEEQ